MYILSSRPFLFLPPNTPRRGKSLVRYWNPSLRYGHYDHLGNGHGYLPLQRKSRRITSGLSKKIRSLRIQFFFLSREFWKDTYARRRVSTGLQCSVFMRTAHGCHSQSLGRKEKKYGKILDRGLCPRARVNHSPLLGRHRGRGARQKILLRTDHFPPRNYCLRFSPPPGSGTRTVDRYAHSNIERDGRTERNTRPCGSRWFRSLAHGRGAKKTYRLCAGPSLNQVKRRRTCHLTI